MLPEHAVILTCQLFLFCCLSFQSLFQVTQNLLHKLTHTPEASQLLYSLQGKCLCLANPWYTLAITAVLS